MSTGLIEGMSTVLAWAAVVPFAFGCFYMLYAFSAGNFFNQTGPAANYAFLGFLGGIAAFLIAAAIYGLSAIIGAFA